MRKTITLITAGALALGLSACGGGGLFNRGAPDEFSVSRQAPLVVPPDFTLSAPDAGTVGNSTGNEAEVLEALFGGPAPRSEVETSMLENAGRAEPGIRTKVGDPDTPTVSKGALTQTIMQLQSGNSQGVEVTVSGS